MKSLSAIRGAALSGVLLLHAPVALAATGSAGGSSAAAGGESTPLNFGASSSGSGAGHAGGSGASIVRTIVGLAIVIAVIYGIFWILRQAKSSKTRPLGRGLQQVATLPLGAGKSVSLVRVGSDVVLLGVAENGVTKIRFYTEEEALEAGLHPDVDLANEEDGPALRVETPVQRALDLLRRVTVRS